MTIQFKNVSFSYGTIDVLKNVSFEVDQGEYVGIIGPNGGGKTTALQLILGFLSPQKGKVEVQAIKRKIGYVPQANTYDKDFPISVLEVVLMGTLATLRWWGTFSPSEKNRAQHFLNEMGCQGLEHRPFGTLSGGQAQKVLIARSLMCDPEILLLDEPTANIDAESERSIFSYLRTIKGEKTILIVTHNFEAIMQNAQRVLCFQHAVSSMKPEEVCKHFTLGMYHG